MYQESTFDRSQKLRDARRQFKAPVGALPKRQSLPYWANYLLRTCVALFLLLAFFLYGRAYPDAQAELTGRLRENVNANSTLWAAYETYSEVDYQDACAKMLEYAKGMLQK